MTRIVDGNSDGTATVDIGALEVQNVTTAASVTVSGRVRTAKGQGITNVRVTLTNSKGETQTVISGINGAFQFTDVPAGETYIFSAAAKRYRFSHPTQVHSILEDTDDIDFVAASLRQEL